MIKDKLSSKINIYFCTQYKTVTSEDVQCLLKIVSNCTRLEFLKVFFILYNNLQRTWLHDSKQNMNSFTTTFNSCYNK